MNFVSFIMYFALFSVSFPTEASIQLNEKSKLESPLQQIIPTDSLIVGNWNLTLIVSIVDEVRGKEKRMSGTIWQFSDSGEFKIIDETFGVLAEGTYTIENDSVLVEYWDTNMIYTVQELTDSKLILSQTLYDYGDSKMISENILTRSKN